MNNPPIAIDILVLVGAVCRGEQVDDEPEEMEQDRPDHGGSLQDGGE